MTEDGNTLSINVGIDFLDSFGQLKSLDSLVGEATANVVREMNQVQQAIKTAVPGTALAQIRAYGTGLDDATAALRKLKGETRAAERDGNAMVRQMQRQVDVFGKTSSEIRNFRAEQKAATAESRGLTELAGRIRDLNGELNRLEAANPGVSSGLGKTGNSANATRFAMQGLSFQAQDTFTQLALGANPLQVLAIQGGQAAGQMAGLGGKLGAVSSFLIGPWGLALTGATLVLAYFTKGLFESDDAADKSKDTNLSLTDALSSVKFGTEAATKAIDEYADAQERSRNSVEKNITLLLQSAKARLSEVIAARQQIDAEYELQRAFAAKSTRGAGGGTDPLIIANNAYAVAQAKNQVELAKAQKAVTELTISNAKIGAETALDPIKKINREFDDQAAAAERAAQGNYKLAASLEATLIAINTRRNSEISKIEAQTKAQKDLNRETEKAQRAAISAAGKDGIWSLSEVQAEIKKIFGAGTQITSTVRKGDKDSDHSVGRALDFVPQKGLSAYSTAEVVKLLSDRGIQVRTSAKGLQAFGPDRGAKTANDHDDHFHIAFEKYAKGKADIAAFNDELAAQNKILAEQQRILDAATKEAETYAAAQREQTATIGLTARELRYYADEAAIAKAPTEALKQAIRDTSEEREAAFAKQSATEFSANVIQPIKDELALYGLVGPARDQAALALQRQAFEAEHLGQGIVVATARWEEYYRVKSELIAKDAAKVEDEERIKRMNDALSSHADIWNIISNNVSDAASGLEQAFGQIGGAIGNLAAIYTDFEANRARGYAEHIQRLEEAKKSGREEFEIARYGLETSTQQIGLYGDLAASAKGFFDEKSKGYQAILAAEKVFRAFEFAMSVRSMVQDVAETISSVANSGARATAAGAEGVAKQSKLPFPANIAAMAATAAALVAAGIAVLGGGGGGSSAPETNTGTGTVLGDGGAQSESIKNAITALRDVDLLMLNTSRQMADSLRTIESNIGGFASLLVRQGDTINASGGVAEGFKANGIGSILGNIPVIGGLLKGLFGTTTTVQASGLFGGPQSLDSILNGGFDASYFSDIQRKKKFFGITTSNRTSTQFSEADSNLENQFTLILREFNSAILAAAGPLGVATSEIEQRLSGFVVDIGRINLQGLSGEEIEERLNAVFGATADNLARAAFPLIDQFQRVGEGAFETLVRVTSTVEAVTSSLTSLGSSARNLGIEVKLGLADQFESISALTNAVDAYFQAYYTEEEQAASRTAQISSVFASLGLTLPSTLAGFRQLVEAQDLTSASGLETYATLLKLAPAFADLQEALNGAKSAADIASEKTDLQRQLLELQGDTAAIRALQLARLDESNRALQEQIYAIQDAREAARAAEELREAWTSVGDSILDEINRIRGIADATGGTSFVTLSGQFNEATLAARAGDQDAARRLPQLSQALLTAAAEAATSRQELDRIQAQTAASLEASYRVISLFGENASGLSSADLLDAAQSGSSATAANNDNARESLAERFEELRQELRQLRTEHMAALAAIAGNTGSIKRTMDNVTQESGGTAISTTAAAA